MGLALDCAFSTFTRYHLTSGHGGISELRGHAQHLHPHRLGNEPRPSAYDEGTVTIWLPGLNTSQCLGANKKTHRSQKQNCPSYK